MKRLIPAILLIFMLLFTGCSNNSNVNNTENGTSNQQQTNTNSNTSGSSNTSNTSNASSGGGGIDTSNLFSARDFEVGYDDSTSAHIQLNGKTAASSSDAVKISGSNVTITDEGTYILSGTLDDGMIIVNSEKTDKVQLVLDDATINSGSSAPIYVLQADKVFITLAPNSVNTLSNGGTFTAIDENNIDAVIFSKEDLTLNGSGSLTIASPTGHGIVSKDELTMTSGTYIITAASHGLEGKDRVSIANAELNIKSGKDGIHAENADNDGLGYIYIQSGTFNITSEGDGIDASAQMMIEDGVFNIVSGGGSANGEQKTSAFPGGFMGGGGRPRPGSWGGNAPGATPNTNAEDSGPSTKGIKAAGNLTLTGGRFTIDSADDAIHSNASITVNGGIYQIATGDDGFHADYTLTVSSGTINITTSYEGLEALHINVNDGDITIYASDDGLNAAGGTDQSGFGGMRGNDRFGGGRPGPSSSSNGSIVITGGKLYINARGDGIDANGTLAISGGYTVVCGPTTGDTATLDFDVSGIITGGTFIGTGAAFMPQTFSDSEQGVIALRVSDQPTGTAITLKDSKGKTLIPSYEPELDYAVVILSSPDLVKGETYTITIGSSSGEFTAE